MRSCWESKPEDRPHFSNLVTRFVHFLGSLAEYFDLVIGASMTPKLSGVLRAGSQSLADADDSAFEP